MSKTPLLAAAASAVLFVLSACQQSGPEVLNTYDPQEDALKNATPVHLPPAVTASKTYRCADNSLAYVDFYNNNTAILRRGNRDAAPTTLTAEGGNPPFTGDGSSVSGTGDHVTINGKSCHT
jgi:hypothetical protein